MTKITPAIKGLITGILMVILLLLFFVLGVQENSPVSLIIYFVYGLGIVWSITVFASKKNNTSTFAELFNVGFRCFIVVTLIMVLYTIVFYKMYYTAHPEIIEKSAVELKRNLTIAEPNRNAREIDEMVSRAKQHPILGHVYLAIFYNLLIGAIVTAATAGSLSLRKKN